MWNKSIRYEIQEMFEALVVVSPDDEAMSVRLPRTRPHTSPVDRAKAAARMRAYRAANPGYEKGASTERARKSRTLGRNRSLNLDVVDGAL